MLAGFYCLFGALISHLPFRWARISSRYKTPSARWDAYLLISDLLPLFRSLEDSQTLQRAQLSLWCDAGFIQSLSLYYLKIVQVLLGISTVAHPGRKEEMDRNMAIVSQEKLVLWEYAECLCHWVHWNKRVALPSLFLHLGTFSLIVNYMSAGGHKRQFNSPWKSGLALTLCRSCHYLVVANAR